LAAKAAEFGQITPFKVIQGHQIDFRHQCETLMQVPCHVCNLPTILRRLRDTADYWSNFRCCTTGGTYLFNTLFWGESLNSGLRNLAPRNWKHPSITVTLTVAFVARLLQLLGF